MVICYLFPSQLKHGIYCTLLNNYLVGFSNKVALIMDIERLLCLSVLSLQLLHYHLFYTLYLLLLVLN